MQRVDSMGAGLAAKPAGTSEASMAGAAGALATDILANVEIVEEGAAVDSAENKDEEERHIRVELQRCRHEGRDRNDGSEGAGFAV